MAWFASEALHGPAAQPLSMAMPARRVGCERPAGSASKAREAAQEKREGKGRRSKSNRQKMLKDSVRTRRLEKDAIIHSQHMGRNERNLRKFEGARDWLCDLDE